MMNLRPMLSEEASMQVDLAANGEASLLQFPMIAQVKFDGFRCIMPHGNPMTRTLKPISNNHVRNQLNRGFGHISEGLASRLGEGHPLHGFDGELIALNAETLSEEDLHRTQSRINSAAGSPRFVYHIFDDFSNSNLPYEKRQEILNKRIADLRENTPEARLETNPKLRSKRIHDHVFQAVESRFCERIEDVLQFEAECLAWGAEGIMLKALGKKYKFGRSTLREGLSLKVKRFSDDEATIIGFNEKMMNLNEATLDERGFTKRSSAKAGLSPAGTLGNIVLKWKGVEFEIGTGWDAATAFQIWNSRSALIGMKVNFQYKGTGPNGKPLIPSFKGIRYDV